MLKIFVYLNLWSPKIPATRQCWCLTIKEDGSTCQQQQEKGTAVTFEGWINFIQSLRKGKVL